MARPLQCPYVLTERIFDSPGLTIECEGSSRTFEDREALIEFACRYCASSIGWRHCTWAQSREIYYGREET
jgi:hypothetical protein